MRLLNHLIFGLLLSLWSPLASANTCQNLFSRNETPLYSNDRLTTQITSQPVNLGNEYRSYRTEDYFALRGKSVNLVIGNSIIEKTQILFLQDLPKARQKLVRLLSKLQSDSKYVNREATQTYTDELARLTALTARTDSNYSPQFIREYAMTTLLRDKKNSVEVGAIILSLKDGRSLTALHTSSRYLRIHGDDLVKALNETLARNGVNLTEVTSIEYFHTHPTPSPLSTGDIQGAHALQVNFLEIAKTKIIVHMSAILNVQGTLVISHYGI